MPNFEVSGADLRVDAKADARAAFGTFHERRDALEFLEVVDVQADAHRQRLLEHPPGFGWLVIDDIPGLEPGPNRLFQFAGAGHFAAHPRAANQLQRAAHGIGLGRKGMPEVLWERLVQ